VLNGTLGNRVETMAPYPCKFCSGWHNGHSPIDATRDLEPKCACKHVALTHNSFPGLGCRECDCLQTQAPQTPSGANEEASTSFG
jgi:hypothetical protein